MKKYNIIEIGDLNKDNYMFNIIYLLDINKEYI